MRCTLLILLLAFGCQKPELPVIDTSGFEPFIASQIEGAAADVRANSRSAAAWGKLAMVLHAYELHPPARVCYERAKALEPKNPQWQRLSAALEAGASVPEVADLRVGLKGWSDKAQQLLAETNHAHAARIIDQLVSGYPNAPESWLLLGRLHLDQNDCAGAEAALRRLLQLSPNSVNAHWQLGIALICLERYAEAVPILQRAVELKPDFGEAYFNLGFAQARSGNGHAAIDSFRQAIRYNPDLIDPYITLADLLAQTGATEEARRLLQRALKLDPADERVRSLLQRL